MSLFYTAHAAKDLENIISHYLTIANVAAAGNIYAEIETEISRIAQNPNRNGDLLDSEIFGVISQFKHAVTQYFRIIYEIIGEDVYIYLIRRQRKNFVSILQERMLR